MSDDEILDLRVGDLMCDDSVIFLWATMTHLPLAFRCLAAWGFKYSTVLVWLKPPRGFKGFPTWSNCVEFCLYGRRGSWPNLKRFDRNWWIIKPGKHSAKPPFFNRMFADTFAGPRIEVFAREQMLGYHAMGWEISGMDVRDEIALELARIERVA